MRKYHLHNGRKGAALAIRVASGAMKDEIVEVLKDGTIKIELNAPKAGTNINQALIEFLARVLEVPGSNIEIVAGESGVEKLVSILDLDARAAQRQIIKGIK